MNKLSVICHLYFDDDLTPSNHVYELRTKNIHSGKWYRLITGTKKEIENYCKRHFPDFDILMNTHYNQIEELRP